MACGNGASAGCSGARPSCCTGTTAPAAVPTGPAAVAAADVDAAAATASLLAFAHGANGVGTDTPLACTAGMAVAAADDVAPVATPVAGIMLDSIAASLAAVELSARLEGFECMLHCAGSRCRAVTEAPDDVAALSQQGVIGSWTSGPCEFAWVPLLDRPDPSCPAEMPLSCSSQPRSTSIASTAGSSTAPQGNSLGRAAQAEALADACWLVAAGALTDATGAGAGAGAGSCSDADLPGSACLWPWPLAACMRLAGRPLPNPRGLRTAALGRRSELKLAPSLSGMPKLKAGLDGLGVDCWGL